LNNKELVLPVAVDDADDEASDSALIALIGAGDDDGFKRLLLRHGRRYVGLAFRLLGQREDAEDIVQEAFIKLWINPERFEQKRGVQFRTWFYRVVVNMCIDVRRRQNNIVLADQLPDVPNEDDAGDADLAIKERMLRHAVMQLPGRQQVAVQLYYFDGLDQTTIAEVLNMNLKAFQSLLHRARTALREKLIEQGAVNGEDGR